VNVGLVAGDGGTALWTLLAGPMRAKEALLTGRPLPAREAYDAGLITAVVPAEDLVARALAFAAQLAELPPYAVRATKAGVNRVVSLVMRDQLDLTLAWERLSMASDDHHRAVKAFLETREASPPGS
jgi:enoyl-CoA hydratase